MGHRCALTADGPALSSLFPSLCRSNISTGICVCVYTLCTMNHLFLLEKLVWPFKLNLILVKSRKQVNTGNTQ